MGVRVGVDTCCLQHLDLQNFLSRSDDNLAVLTDFTIAEMFKGDPLLNAGSSWTILSNFPQQVITLKPLGGVVAASVKRPCLADRFVNKEETKAASKFSHVLSRARSGNLSDLQLLENRRLQAERYMEILRVDASQLNQMIDFFRTHFSTDESRSIRGADRATHAATQKFINLFLDYTDRELFLEREFFVKKIALDF